MNKVFGILLVGFVLTGLTIPRVLSASSFDTSAPYALVSHFDSGEIFFERNADAKIAPGSAVKLMTVYIAFQRLKVGAMNLDDKFLVSKKAWVSGGAKTFVERFVAWNHYSKW